jgi:DNA-binding CsgD family transcriptional regulator
MTRVIFYFNFNTASPGPGVYGSAVSCSTLIWDDALPAATVAAAINLGSYRFPLIPHPGQVTAIQQGDLVIATRPASVPDPEIHLTRREKEVLFLLVDGQSMQQISRLLHLKPRTVTGHVTHLKDRLGVASREQLVARAVAMGLYQPPPG